MSGPQANESSFVFTTKHTFNAPRERVWQAWMEPQQRKQWFGPKGCVVVFGVVDIRPGGASLYCINFNGSTTCGKWTYKEIKAPEKLVSLATITDESGEKILPHPSVPNWPLEVLSTVTFVAQGNNTEIIVQWKAYNATEIERKTFEEGASLMKQGWTDSFGKLEEFLAK